MALNPLQGVVGYWLSTAEKLRLPGERKGQALFNVGFFAGRATQALIAQNFVWFAINSVATVCGTAGLGIGLWIYHAKLTNHPTSACRDDSQVSQ